MNKTNEAFTLVELIVVITILAILGTIAFISLQGYSKKARDSRRIADISNIKTSLELFSLNTGFYPLPDNGEEVLYDNDLLWTQGVVGTNVTTNLSRNLLKKPTDPLHDIEYIYSLTSSKKEYEVMSVYEGGLVNTNLLNSTYALDKYNVKVEGNYNELFVKTARHIVPVPSIITSAALPLDFDLVPNAIESQVITGGNNFPGLNIPNTETSTGGLKMNLSVYSGSINKDSIDDIKKTVIEKIQLAYSGSDVENVGVYKTLLEQTTDDELIAFIDDVVLNYNYNNSTGNISEDIIPDSTPSISICPGSTITEGGKDYDIQGASYTGQLVEGFYDNPSLGTNMEKKVEKMYFQCKTSGLDAIGNNETHSIKCNNGYTLGGVQDRCIISDPINDCPENSILDNGITFDLPKFSSTDDLHWGSFFTGTTNISNGTLEYYQSFLCYSGTWYQTAMYTKKDLSNPWATSVPLSGIPKCDNGYYPCNNDCVDNNTTCSMSSSTNYRYLPYGRDGFNEPYLTNTCDNVCSMYERTCLSVTRGSNYTRPNTSNYIGPGGSPSGEWKNWNYLYRTSTNAWTKFGMTFNCSKVGE